ncbi:hypothetical protein PC116_g8402 [Phytophthora cactorum]|uniref:Uncharacterized protein n=1 Tax=Phytophthora cactorum TaxID=29920 RepID=A0A8T1E9H0_9STRA|nr:hypothetical protein Pcac1_g23160 [Phytophthora cactorum]KAG2898097.1 hypothetical protein PC114_g14420 [Phytophthora cactorum]KAG2948409.1 hypothetical protein PC117_g6063 [Phytophthora cactorum]KAG3016389.1 hypothetical protein PC120_g11657 [Phytophthora cactorum]KAG3027385.1 hypothetical protein PC119_g7403 [Phytophthora cactorum]
MRRGLAVGVEDSATSRAIGHVIVRGDLAPVRAFLERSHDASLGCCALVLALLLG